MGRRERIDVVEGERMLVLVNPLGGDLAAQDAREDVALIVRPGRVDWHEPDSGFDKRPVKAIVRVEAAGYLAAWLRSPRA